MKQAQIDYLNWRYALKSNYQKGLHTLRSILADPAQAKMFAENPAAVAVVLSYDTENPDKNAVELHNLLSKSSVAEIASNTYICNTYGVADFGELFADEELMAEVLEDEASMNAIVASESAMKVIAYDSEAMSSIASSSTAMTSIVSSETAMEVISKSPTAMAAVSESSTAMELVVPSVTAMTAVASSKTATDAVAASATAMSFLAGNADAMNSIASSSTAVASMTASSTAMDIISESGMAVAKYLAGATGLNPAAYADMGAVAKSGDAMAPIVADSYLVEVVAGSPVALHAICGADAGRDAFNNGPYRQTHRAKILESLADTTYFSKTSFSTASSGYYHYNAANPTGVDDSSNDAVKPDACWAYITYWRVNVTETTGELYFLEGVGINSSTQIVSSKDTGSIYNSNANLIVAGGFRTGNSLASGYIYSAL